MGRARIVVTNPTSAEAAPDHSPLTFEEKLCKQNYVIDLDDVVAQNDALLRGDDDDINMMSGDDSDDGREVIFVSDYDGEKEVKVEPKDEVVISSSSSSCESSEQANDDGERNDDKLQNDNDGGEQVGSDGIVVEDYTDMLLNDYPSGLEEEEAAVPPPPPPPPQPKNDKRRVTREFVVDVAGHDEEFANPSIDIFSCDRVARTLRSSRHLNLEKWEKVQDAPLILAKSICRIKGSTNQTRSNLGKLFCHFATRWNEREKKIFFDHVGEADAVCNTSKIIRLLQMKNFDLVFLVSLSHEFVIDVLRVHPDRIKPFFSLLSDIFGETPAKKLSIFKSREYAMARAKYFTEAATDDNLTQLCKFVSRTFCVEMPIKMRMAQFPKCLADINRKRHRGTMDFNMAVEIIDKYTAGEHNAAIRSLEPYAELHAHFMRAWYGAETEGFKTPPPPNKCAVDEFHNVPMRSVKVLTDDMANRVVERIKKEDVLYITIWECNDHRFDPDGVGVVGFMAARWDESFFISQCCTHYRRRWLVTPSKERN